MSAKLAASLKRNFSFSNSLKMLLDSNVTSSRTHIREHKIKNRSEVI